MYAFPQNSLVKCWSFGADTPLQTFQNDRGSTAGFCFPKVKKKVTATHAVFVVANTCWMLLIDSIFAPIDL